MDTPPRKVDTLAKFAADTPGARLVPTQVDEDGSVVETWWVPYGPAFEIPLRFSYDGSGPFDWRMNLLVIEGRPRCVQLIFDTVDFRRTITAEGLHRFSLGRFIEEATLMASRPTDEVQHTFKRWNSPDEARAARAEVLRQHRRRENGKARHRLNDEFLAQVAAVYREHVTTGSPSKAVAEHFNYSLTSARRVVREARLRGFLGPARLGRGGEQPKGKENG
jgi:hypothetical protein